MIPCRNCAVAQSTCNSACTGQPAILLPANIPEHVSHAIKRLAVRTISKLPPQVPSDLPFLYLNQLYTTSLPLSYFTGAPTTSFIDLHPVLQRTPALRNSAFAISILLTHGASTTTRHRIPLAATQALYYYDRAVTALRTELAQSDSPKSDPRNGLLWTTLLLSIFEVMYDQSGDGAGFVTHLLQGTSTILQQLGPRQCLSAGPSGSRRFFLSLRIFEISRALIFTSETFLNRPEWQEMMHQMWTGDGVKDWHPIESLYDLMIECVALAVRYVHIHGLWTSRLNNRFKLLYNRVHNLLTCCSSSRPIVESSCPPNDVLVVTNDFASRGLSIRAALSTWHYSYHHENSRSGWPPDDVRTALCQIYYPATAIYLDGIFSYHPMYYQDLDIPTPVLSPAEIQTYLVSILSQVSHNLYHQKTLAGMLFLFPLRVAGARAREREHTLLIRDMLGEIVKKGFMVAETFVQDLDELWSTRQIIG